MLYFCNSAVSLILISPFAVQVSSKANETLGVFFHDYTHKRTVAERAAEKATIMAERVSFSRKVNLAYKAANSVLSWLLNLALNMPPNKTLWRMSSQSAVHENLSEQPWWLI